MSGSGLTDIARIRNGDHAHVAPEHAFAQSGSQSLRAGFFGREPLGIGGGALLPPVALAALDVGENAIDETAPCHHRSSRAAAG